MVNTNHIDKISAEIQKANQELENKIKKAQKEYNDKVQPLKEELLKAMQNNFEGFPEPVNIKHKGKVLGQK